MQDNILENVSENPVIEKIIGQFKTKEKFLEFVGIKGNFNFISNEATIEGKYLSGLDLDGVKFKLTICDEGTVNFDEIETSKTTAEQRERLLEVISEKTITIYNKRMVVQELPFKSVKAISLRGSDEKNIDMWLSVEHQTPISRLASFFEDEKEIEVSDDQNSKLDTLFSFFDEEAILEGIPQEVTKVDVDLDQTETQKNMVETFKKMKEEKIIELHNRIEQQESELKRFEFEKAQAEKKIETSKVEIKVLESRMDSLRPIMDPNGYIFNVSEQKNEKVILEDNIANIIKEKVAKVKTINADNFMKLFESGEYHIRLGHFIEENEVKTLTEVADYPSLPEEIKVVLIKIGITYIDSKLIYIGDLNWHDLVNKMVKNGFVQEVEFDKMCGSNSYSIGNEAEPTEISPIV